MTTTTEATRLAGAVGVAHTRVEGLDKVTGAARYAAEHHFTELAHGWLVLSTVARGRITGIDSAPVEAMPGVLAVLHHENAPRLERASGFFGPDPTVQVLQDDRVPHVGWPVALVVAETPEVAREAAESLVVHYEQEPHDTVFRAEHPDTYTPGDDSSETSKGDLEAELAASAVVVDEWYTTPEEHHNAMEPHGAIARWEDGRLEVIDTTQGAFATAQDLAALLSLDPSSVRVVSEHVGGGFGSKGLVRPHSVLAAMAATVVHRPVRVVMTRRQVFSLVGHRPATAQRMRLGADADGRLRALDHQASSYTSRVMEYVETSAAISRVLYGADAHHTVNRVVPLDVPTPRWMRAPGEAPGSFAVESAMDELAQRCGVDPVALRIRNEPAVGPVSGLPFSSRSTVACFEEGARRFGWGERDPRPAVRREGRWLLGTGVAAATYTAGVVPSTASVTAEAGGDFTVRITAADIGTGARTALVQIAADALEVPVGRIRMRIADSDFGQAMLAGGSTGTRSWAHAIVAAVAELRAVLVPGMEIPSDGITVRGNSLDAVRGLANLERHSFGAQFAEAAVDIATGEVRVRRMLGMFAAGRVVNPLTARSQLVGGMVWGLSMALHEEAHRDPASGGLVGGDLAGYHIAANADVPLIEADWVNEVDPHDPTGIKGLGEIGIVGAAAAVANAVWHATGVRHRQLPIRPDRVLAAAAAERG
ncbi:xanthine dehydrogenase family protein molybdopterin-binding subunit [Streptomyces sp. NRRL F-5126]|uniref:xanthine dehydrogenase family protein molybdopterin-binding subunit n=1 Tax=Streptomyces sp. NRRL F-5126 TaxID=1463857 RepID=UPI0004C954E4|nr:xanthine dehydrogenase family protein molybdopterin-binding subunit [Streptomyces sp. NRRL F-5126]